MKKLLSLLVAVTFALIATAQNIDQIITKSYTDYLIKTLSSDDMQGRGAFTPGIDKAASFIEEEFKKIGLKPLAGAPSFRQSFNKIKVSAKQKTVIIDGNQISGENIFSINSAELTTFDQTDATLVKLDVSKPFNTQVREILRERKKQMVLVDEKFKTDFEKYKAHYDEGNVANENDIISANPTATVFVLGNFNDAKAFSARLENTLEQMPLFNVVGVIPGKSKAKELVVFSGHYDHLGITKAVEGDSIANGADDDASGTSAVIALAKYYKAVNNNERTLIFVAFTAEEIGGYGSKYFSEKLNPDKVVAMFNIEMIGKESKFGKNTAFITGYEKSDFGSILQKNLAGTEFTFHPDPYPNQNLFYRSDNATLAALGVPAHTISTDQIDIDKLYHTVKDEYSSLDVDNILSTIKAIAKSATSIINGKDTPARIPKLK